MIRLACLSAVVATCCFLGPASAAAQEPLPDDAVARVGEELVPKVDFQRWLRIATSGQPPGVFDPPRFERCIAAERRRLEKGQRGPSTAELRRRCERRYRSLVGDAMQFVLQSVWVRQEAAANGIAVSRRQVRRAFTRQKRVAFDTEPREYRRFLRRSGQTEADILHRVELNLLQARLTRKAVATAPRVTREDVSRYYANHRQRYRGIPVSRARRLINRRLTATRQQRAAQRYVADFRRRYDAMTVCAPDYLVPECGAVAAPARR